MIREVTNMNKHELYHNHNYVYLLTSNIIKMCIRDRSEAANGKPFAHYWMHNAFLNIDNHKTVSYTHLDVYKRQVPHW